MHVSQIENDVGFLIRESCETLQKFAAKPKSYKVETIVQCVDLVSSLIKRVESIAPENGSEARSAAIQPFWKVSLLRRILEEKRQPCQNCGGWTDKE
jgi:hypothetical protein